MFKEYIQMNNSHRSISTLAFKFPSQENALKVNDIPILYIFKTYIFKIMFKI